jgi:hypothetical protein
MKPYAFAAAMFLSIGLSACSSLPGANSSAEISTPRAAVVSNTDSPSWQSNQNGPFAGFDDLALGE